MTAKEARTQAVAAWEKAVEAGDQSNRARGQFWQAASQAGTQEGPSPHAITLARPSPDKAWRARGDALIAKAQITGNAMYGVPIGMMEKLANVRNRAEMQAGSLELVKGQLCQAMTEAYQAEAKAWQHDAKTSEAEALAYQAEAQWHQVTEDALAGVTNVRVQAWNQVEFAYKQALPAWKQAEEAWKKVLDITA